MGKKTRIKQEKEVQKVAKYADTLRASNPKQKHYKTSQFDRVNALDRLLPKYKKYNTHFIRDPKNWKCRSYNPEVQDMELLRHLFCKYPVPKFFFEAFAGTMFVKTEWFFAVAQGGSFRKYVKDIFTSKEAHLFLQGPKGSGFNNFWWAKAKARGIPDVLLDVVLVKVGTACQANSRLDFIAKYVDQLDRNTLSELYDFWMNSPDLVYEGRTLASMIRLSNEWHRDIAIKKNHQVFASWDGLSIPDWERDDEQTDRRWNVYQLRNSKELNREGTVQCHCVSGYHSQCSSGYTSIFTLHSLDKIGTERKHVTIQVTNSNRCVVQVRGKFNRAADKSETRVVRSWASENGLQITAYCMR